MTGDPVNVVASDLTIRLRANHAEVAPFLSAYLSHLYLSGYWRERAGGASGSMKKITRTQIAALEVPVPTPADRAAILVRVAAERARATALQSATDAELSAVEALPEALLRDAFCRA